MDEAIWRVSGAARGISAVLDRLGSRLATSAAIFGVRLADAGRAIA